MTELLGMALPIVAAPMGGGPSTPELVASVSDAGGLGSLAGGYQSPEALRTDIATVRRLTAAPFAVNLFAGGVPGLDPIAFEQAVTALGPLREELGLPLRPALGAVAPALEAQIEVVRGEAPAAVSFTFGLLDPAAVDELHSAGCVLIGTATSVAEAMAVADAGADAVCAQGFEAGAHRGTFLGPGESSLVGTLALVPQVCDAVAIPVIAAGAVMDGRGLAAVLSLGAGAAQMGTAFLRCPEAGTSIPYREALALAVETSTALTSRVTGRLARGIDNRLMRTLASCDVPAYPIMHALTSELRRTAGVQGVAELMSLWCGQGVAMGTERPAGEVARLVANDAATVLADTAAGCTSHQRG
ncbi:MAG: nitronate monooxygenase [Acidimicrobiales bacterium]